MPRKDITIKTLSEFKLKYLPKATEKERLEKLSPEIIEEVTQRSLNLLKQIFKKTNTKQ